MVTDSAVGILRPVTGLIPSVCGAKVAGSEALMGVTGDKRVRYDGAVGTGAEGGGGSQDRFRFKLSELQHTVATNPQRESGLNW